MKKFFMYCLIVLLLAGMMPVESTAAAIQATNNYQTGEGVIKVPDETEGEPVLFQEPNIESEAIISIPRNAVVDIIEESEEDFVRISYVDKEQNVTYTGYIQRQFLQDGSADEAIMNEEADLSEQETEVNLAESQEVLTGLALKQPVKVFASNSKEAEVLKYYNYGTLLKYQSHSAQWNKATVYVDGEPQTGYIHKDDIGTADKARTVTGIVIKKSVHVYNDTDKTKVLKSYENGSILKYKAHEKGWYSAVIFVKGKKQTGYISAKDVETAFTDSEIIKGIANKNSTYFYKKADKTSKRVKGYPEGQLLKVKQFTNNWYEGTVYVKGNPVTGYLSAKDLEIVKQSGESIKGVAFAKPVHVYDRASKSAKSLKSYTYGSILKVRDFSENWYEATIIKKGTRITGYIHRKDIASMDTVLSGYAQKSNTPIYKENSTASEQIKTYSIGSKLKYNLFDADWHQVTVYIDGVKTTGYLNKNDVGNVGPAIHGYAYKDRTYIYNSADRSSKKLKSYAKGSSLKYRAYNDDWYQVTVKINGKSVTGYLNKKDAGKDAPTITGYAKKSSTKVYTKASGKSKVLKTYKTGTLLKFKPYNNNWYQATVVISGKSVTGYINKKDIGKNVDISFVNPYKTYTYATMTNDIKKLEKAYPDLIQYKVIGKSEYGRNIYAVGLGKGDTNTLINGSIHAREWLSSALNMYMLENYAKSYTKNTKINGFNTRNILNNATIWFVPMVNPDGVTIQQRGLNAIQKKDQAKLIKANGGSTNFKRWKANADGVDINRNFSVHWSKQSGPKSPSHQNYRGPRALSSKEAQTLAKFVIDTEPKMSINYHTSGEVLYWAHIQTGSRYTRDLNHARNINKMTGYSMIPKSKNPSGGGFLQYFTETTKMPSITPELAPYAGHTHVSPSRYFSSVWNKNKAVGLYAAQESIKLDK